MAQVGNIGLYVTLSIAIVIFLLVDRAASDFDQERSWACIKPPGTYPSYTPRHLCGLGFYCDCNTEGTAETNVRYGKDCKCTSTASIWEQYYNQLLAEQKKNMDQLTQM